MSAAQEERILKAQASNLEQMLADVRRRISEISGEGAPSDEHDEKKK